MKLKHILLLMLILPIFQGCDNSDDVEGIFTGKTWKLTGIYYKNNVERTYDFWNGNEAARKASEDKWKQAANFTISFSLNNLQGGDEISGACMARATGSSLNGEWYANGKNNSFGTSKLSVSDSDVLGQAYLYGLRNAYKYDGDYNNLRIYYDLDNGEELFLLFHVQ